MEQISKTKRIALLGILFAAALVLSYLESLLPPIPGLPPGIKLGLSNVVTMYCLYFVGFWPAVGLAALKAGFVLITRGATAAFLSAAGGLLSVGAMAIAIKLLGEKRKIAASVTGAVFHNVGQALAATAILSSTAVLVYAPVLVVAGVVVGVVTGLLLRAVLPALKRLR